MNGPRWWVFAFVVSTAIWVFILGIIWLAWPKAGGFSPDLPPKEYRGDARVTVHFTRHSNVLCRIAKAQDPNVIACAGVNSDWMIVPNPCDWKSDVFARLMCHEKGHNLGYPADHPK